MTRKLKKVIFCLTHENLQVTVAIIVNENEATFRLVCRRLTVYVGHAFITIKKLICLFSKAIVKMLKEKIDLLRYQQEMSENPLHYACIFLNFTKALFLKEKKRGKQQLAHTKRKHILLTKWDSSPLQISPSLIVR